MPKGFFTQTAVVLLREPVGIEEIASVLHEYSPSQPAPAAEQWAVSGPAVAVTFNEEVNGKIAIDTVDHPWPDDMGDPEDDPALFSAWGTGQFGPFTHPGSLTRATEQAWAWEEGRTLPQTHRAFIRVRSSYVLGGTAESPLLPEEYDAYEDLVFVTEIAAKLAELPQAICYFNPNGEVLRDLEGMEQSIEFANEDDLPPHELWTNIRLFKVDDEWSLMDTVGNGQLDLPDCEACFHTESYELDQIDNFLRNCILYLIDEGDVIEDGDTSEGPGDIPWQARRCDWSLSDPPREVIRWFPQDNRPVPETLNDPESINDPEAPSGSE